MIIKNYCTFLQRLWLMLNTQRLYLWISLIVIYAAVAVEGQVIIDSFPLLSIDDALEVYVDSSGEVVVDEILQDTSNRFLFQPFNNISQPLDPNFAYWGRISILLQKSTDTIWLAFRGRNYLFNGWYRGNGKSEVWEYGKGRVVHYHVTGADVPRKSREISKGFNINRVPLQWDAMERKHLLIRIKANSFGSSPDFGLTLQAPDPDPKYPGPFWWVSANGYVVFLSFLLGFILMALLYHLVLFIYLREEIYGWFSLWLLFPLLANMMVHPSGFISEYLTPNYPSWRNFIWTTCASLVWVAFWQFGRYFILAPQRYAKLDKAMKGLILLLIINIISNLLLTNVFDQANAIYYPILGLLNLAGLIMAGFMLFLRDRRTIYFGGGAIVACGSVILGALWTNGVISVPFDPFVSGILLQIIIYSFGLAYIRQIAAREKTNAESRALQNEKEKAEQLDAINQASSKFVPKAYMDFLGLNNILDAKLGTYVERQVTVLFSDIRNYTSLSEELTPRQNFEFINDLHNRMGTVIHEQGGFVNQYLGDGLMAIFPKEATQALIAAKAMQRELQAYNEIRQLDGHPSVEIGIGLHSGPLIMGFIGDKNRMDAATISDTVNAASRIEGLTKKYGVSILLSGTCRDKIRDIGEFHLRYLGTARVKGKMRSLELFECFDVDPIESIVQKNATRIAFRKGIKFLMNGRVKKAHKLFREISSQNPYDFPARYFLDKQSQDLKDNPNK